MTLFKRSFRLPFFERGCRSLLLLLCAGHWLAGCGGSSSETPPPADPYLERVTPPPQAPQPQTSSAVPSALPSSAPASSAPPPQRF